MATEITRAQRWVFSQVASNADVGVPVYEYPAPQGVLPPYVLIDFRGAKDNTMLGQRAGVVAYWAVVAVGEDTPTLRLESIADAIDASLSGQSGSSGDVAIQTCERTQTLLNASLQAGDQRRSLGGLYKLNLSPDL